MRTRPIARTASASDTDEMEPSEVPAVVATEEQREHAAFWLHLLAFLGLVVCGAFGVYVFFSTGPQLEGTQCDGIGLPSLVKGVLPKFVGGDGNRMGTTEKVWRCAQAYQKHHPTFVLLAFCIVYITLQTLAIPGPIVLSVLSGALYPAIPAQILVAFCATTGASLCFTISYFLGNDIVHVLLPGMISNFRKKTEANKGNLMNYLLFLRLTPLLPNWFVNVASPVVGVPLWKFALATFVGLIPANYFHCQTGKTLSKLKNGDLTNPSNFNSVAFLMVLQFVPLIPTLFKSRLRRMEAERFGAAGEAEADSKAE